MLSVSLAFAACASPPIAGDDALEGDGVVVHLLDADFVRVGDRRIPWEALVYELRVRCREQSGAGSPPWVRFVAPVDAEVPPATVDAIQRGLREAGIRQIDMTLAGS